MILRRRDFITLLGGAAAWPLAARAQQPTSRLPRIAILILEEWQAGVLTALQALGWVEGRTAHIDLRNTVDDANLTRARARELLALNPDLIFVTGAVGARAFQTVCPIPCRGDSPSMLLRGLPG